MSFTTERSDKVVLVDGIWQFIPEFYVQVAKPPLLPKQWNPPVANIESRLRQLERNQQTLLNTISTIAENVTALAARPGLTAEDVSKLLNFDEATKDVLDDLLNGDIINRIVALETP